MNKKIVIRRVDYIRSTARKLKIFKNTGAPDRVSKQRSDLEISRPIIEFYDL